VKTVLEAVRRGNRPLRFAEWLDALAV